MCTYLPPSSPAPPRSLGASSPLFDGPFPIAEETARFNSPQAMIYSAARSNLGHGGGTMFLLGKHTQGSKALPLLLVFYVKVVLFYVHGVLGRKQPGVMARTR